MQCSSCGFENQDGMNFCGKCGTRLANVCPDCGYTNPPDHVFCGKCGTSLMVSALPQQLPQQPATDQARDPASYTPQHLAEKILTTRSAMEGERKQVTVMFCDLANSTALAQRIGPEAMHTLLNRFFELALSDVHRYEGTINQFLGDGFMALFGAPIAHEDHARRAMLTALALQRTLQAHHAELGEPHGVACQFRIGLNSGIVVIGSIGDNLRMDYSAIGDTTNLASRLQQLAEPGEILVSESTSRLVEGDIRLVALPPLQVKGKTDAVIPYRVNGILPRRSLMMSRGERTLSRFVGRESELATLEALFAQVEAGQGQVIGIVAEAGAGKSRLLYEFRQWLADKQVTYLEGRCLSYGRTIPYHPIIDVVRDNCGITDTDRSEAIVEKVGVALNEVGMDAEESGPYILQLLGAKEGTASLAMLTPEAIKSRTFDTLRQMSLQSSQQHPLIFAIEDLHWLDRTSEDFLVALVESLPGASMLLLTTYRPGFRPPWIEKSYATQISLRSLASQDAVSVVHSIRQHRALPEPLAQTIVQKAEGNPFFLEELTRAIIEHGDFQADMMVPDTIQGVLMARIDRLQEEPKRLLQTASVLGREFSPRLLSAIWDNAETLQPLLLELKQLEFLYEHSGIEEPSYVFKHALTQEVAYDSLLTTRKQVLHAMAGQTLESLYADHLEDAYDRLAYHYARTDKSAKAVEYQRLIAERAARAYAHAEAAATLQDALVHAGQLSEQERDHCCLDLAIRQADSLFFLGRRQELVNLLHGQRARLEQLDEPLLSGLYYLGLGHAYSFLGARQQAMDSLQRALDEGTTCNDVITMGRAHTLLTLEHSFAGRLQQGMYHGEQAVTLLEQTADYAWLGLALYYRGGAYWFSGQLHHVLEGSNRLYTLGETVGDRRLQTNGLTSTGIAYTLLGECEAGIEVLEHACAISPDAFETAFTLGQLGYAYMEKGDRYKSISTLEQALEEVQQYRSLQVQSWFNTYLAEAYLLDEQTEKAYHHARQAIVLAEDIQHPWGAALAKRTLGRAAHNMGNLAEAETHLQESLAQLATIQSRFDQARTHLDLASLDHTQGNRDTATTHLRTAYAWFKKLQVPKWAEKTARLAREYGISMPEIEMEELTEGEA